MNKQANMEGSGKDEARPILDIEGLRTIVSLRWQELKTAFWEVLGCMVVAVLLGLLIASRLEPTYRATVTLLVQPEGSRVSPVEDIQRLEGPVSQQVLTKQQILRSRALAGRVVDELNLTEHPFFKRSEAEVKSEPPARWEELLGTVKEWLGPVEAEPEPRDPREYAIGKMVSEVITVESVGYTYAVDVHAKTPEAELSVRIANALAEEYMDYTADQRVDLSGQAAGWLRERLVELKADLDESQARLQAFYEEENLLNVGGERALIAEEYSKNSEQLREARGKMAQLEGIYRKIKQADGDISQLENINHIQSTNLVLAAKNQYFEAREAVSELESRYGPKHPKMISSRAKLREARENYENQILQTAGAVSSEYEVARSTVEALEQTLGGSRSELAGLDQMQHKLQALKENVEMNRELYNSFQRRIRETNVSSNTTPGDTRIIDTAVLPSKRFAPSYKRWALGSALVGAFAGLLITLLRLFLDDTVNTAEDMAALSGYSVLASLPHLKKIEKHAEQVARVELDDPGSPYAEAIRTLRTAIYLSDASKPQKKILIASSIPSEGKTCLAANLALAFGGMGRTLLLDCDLRNPSGNKYLGLENNHKAGLVELMAGRASKADAIRRFEPGNIDVLSCVESPPNPSELIGSERFSVLLDDLARDYDRIIIDSPPCQVVSDALMLASQVDTTLFLAKAGSTPKRMITEALKRLRDAGAPILGTVLSQIDVRKADDYGLKYYSAYYRSEGSA